MSLSILSFFIFSLINSLEFEPLNRSKIEVDTSIGCELPKALELVGWMSICPYRMFLSIVSGVLFCTVG